MPTPDLVAVICAGKNIMNKRFTALMTTLILSVIFSISASAYDVEVDGIYYNLISKGNVAEVTKGDKKYSGDITIPSSIKVNEVDYAVTSIGASAFEWCSGLTSVTIPNSVTSIGGAAFQYCSGLTSVTIPNSVTSIGTAAFNGCSGLTSVTIPNSVTSIGDYAFRYCSGLTTITVDADNPIYDSRNNCNAIIETATKTLVYGCKNTVIPSSVTSIGHSAFDDCSGLTSVTIPNSVTSIGGFAFSGCSGLTSITIPNSVTSIGNWAFQYCSGLTSVTIPNSVTSIGNWAFQYCSGLTSVTIPNSVTSIGGWAFRDCSSLTSITIPNSVTSIGSGAFSDCSRLTSITIPNSVTSIGNHAFAWCSGLTSVTIPNSVTSIGDFAFSGCRRLEDIIIVNNMFVYLPETYSGHYSIPENISQIIGGAFYNCKGLTSITIPNSVTSIGYYAFDGCSGLTSITIPNSVTSIGEYTFNGCRGLTSVTIPNSVTSIGENAFKGCTGLTSVTIPNSVTSIGNYAFASHSKLKNVYCYAEKFSRIGSEIFNDSNIESATLHVPSSALFYYQTTEPWSGFGTIKALEGTEAEAKKCEKPVISYNNGELSFTCATEGVEYVSKINSDDFNSFYTQLVQLSGCYNISVTATKAGYEDSDVATAKLYWLPTADVGTNINTAKTRGVVIQSAGGFITLSGLETNERVDFFTVDGVALGSATATDGTATFSAKSGTIVVAKIGKESVKIAVE